nr:unnamed protein product [Callosobruchus analis]
MPRHCCVPGCEINYCSELKSVSYRSVFGFPKNEELKSKGLIEVPKKNWSHSKNQLLVVHIFAYPKFSQLRHFY